MLTPEPPHHCYHWMLLILRRSHNPLTATAGEAALIQRTAAANVDQQRPASTTCILHAYGATDCTMELSSHSCLTKPLAKI